MTKTEEIARIYDKTLRVIASCTTADHLKVADSFARAALKVLDEKGGNSLFAQECRYSIATKVWEKKESILPQTSNQKGLAYQPAQFQTQQYYPMKSTGDQFTGGNLFGSLLF